MAQSDVTTTAATPAEPRDGAASRRIALPRRAVLTAAAAAAMIGRPAFAEEKQLVLGCSLPLSGPAAPTGITTQRTIEHALELINAKGITIGPDRYTIKAVFYDNKYVPAEAVTIVEKMLADGVRYLVLLGLRQFRSGGGKDHRAEVHPALGGVRQGPPDRAEVPLQLPRAADQRNGLCRLSLAEDRLPRGQARLQYGPQRRGRVHRVPRIAA